MAKIKCPKCDFETEDFMEFAEHLEASERHYPGNAYKILLEMVQSGKLGLTVADKPTTKERE